MSNDNDFFNLKNEWQNQSFQTKEVTMEMIIKKSDAFTNKINMRNSLEWSVILILTPVFLYHSFQAETVWSQLMNLELAMAGVFIALHLFFRGRTEVRPDFGASTEVFIGHQKRQLERQIELLSKAKYWYVAPILFGLVGLTVEKIYLNWSASAPPVFEMIYLAVVLAVGAGITWLNEVKAVNDLRAKLEDLS